MEEKEMVRKNVIGEEGLIMTTVMNINRIAHYLTELLSTALYSLNL